MRKELGLIGFPLEHSFSPAYFRQKFDREGLDEWTYELFPLSAIDLLFSFLNDHKHLVGFNVTIPYKQSILPFLDLIHPDAKRVGAVNTVRVTSNGLVGYNTDVPAFQQVLTGLPSLSSVTGALVLGTGGAAKAVCYSLSKLGIPWSTVSRTKDRGDFVYNELNEDTIRDHNLIIHASPLGMFPHMDTFPELPYGFISTKHILIDLIYNPEETIFLKEGKKRGASTCNGLEMLYLQAEKSWQIWTHSNENEF